mmetsp:Transcript_6107/g.5255  ORF Transcript_6107/g.5255 Transcript_6107/m.5255 type:complete len:363 (+) Transcript_6107:936-2024(+)
MSNNKINSIKDTRGLISIKKIDLSHNFIDIGLDKIKNLDRVVDFSIENNPISRKPDFHKFLKKTMPKIMIYNGRKAIVPKEINGMEKLFESVKKPEVLSPLEISKDANNNVIKIIHKEWAKEVDRLKKNFQNYEEGKSKNSTEKCLVQSGHAEIESNKLLFIYGNAMEVLKRSEFYPVVEEMYLESVRFDHIVHYTHLDRIRKFTNLKKLHLAHNNLNSLILLSKLECLQSIENLIIENNDILSCDILKSFIVYRFQHLKTFNKVEITEEDREDAKQNFHIFDNILSKCIRRIAPNISDPVKKQEFKQNQKKHAEISQAYIRDIIDNVLDVNSKDDEIEEECEYTLLNVIRESLDNDGKCVI